MEICKELKYNFDIGGVRQIKFIYLEGVVIMQRSKMQSGYIELEEKSYIFTYDGELLQLVPKEQSSIKPYIETCLPPFFFARLQSL